MIVDEGAAMISQFQLIGLLLTGALLDSAALAGTGP